MPRKKSGKKTKDMTKKVEMSNKSEEPVFKGTEHGPISVGSVKATVYSSKEKDGTVVITARYYRGETAHEDSILIKENGPVIAASNLMSAAIYKVLSNVL